MSNLRIPYGPTIRFYFDPKTFLNISWYTYLENLNGVQRFLSIKFVLLCFVLEPVFCLGQTKEYKEERARFENALKKRKAYLKETEEV